jgi:tripartite-type tricarboxylate transporter receptor subunit TctC
MSPPTRPNGLAYASVGSGSIGHLFMVLLQKNTGVKLTHVPYRGGAPAMNDAIGGHVDFIIGSVALVTPQLGTGKLRPIVQTGEKRVAALPDVPTVAETVPGLTGYTWWGVFAPAGTPRPIVERFNRELAASIREERVMRQLTEAQQMTLVMSGPDELRAFNTAQGKLWGAVVRENEIKGEM